MAAELGHDLQGPLNLFRLMTERVEQGESLDAEDASLMREELDRLRSLSQRLRELSRWSPQPAEHLAREVVRVALALPPAIVPSAVELQLGDSDLAVACDLELTARALRELVDNALEARRERVGLRIELGERPCFCVWDDGAGFVREPSTVMRFGQTTREGAAGIGLTLALRAARAQGFRLELGQTDHCTEARLVLAPAGGSEWASRAPR
jgi:signal transduction histidine kinase